MTYRPKARDEDTLRDIEPLGVTYYGGSWYLVAWCRLRADYRSFKLERVRQLEVLAERFAGRPDFSIRAYMERSMASEETIMTRLWFSTNGIERARRESFASITSERRARDGWEIEVRTFSLEWLSHWLLSFGKDAEALAPAKLRTAVRKEALAIAQRHA